MFLPFLSNISLTILLLFAFLILSLLYIFGFIFIHGSSPGKDKGQDDFIDKTCAPSGLLKTVLTWGYFKASFRRFLQFYRLCLFPQPQAKLGKPAVDAVLIDLVSNSEKYLLKDYVMNMPSGMPLILNMGSYT
jgi:hypothetical protein